MPHTLLNFTNQLLRFVKNCSFSVVEYESHFCEENICSIWLNETIFPGILILLNVNLIDLRTNLPKCPFPTLIKVKYTKEGRKVNGTFFYLTKSLFKGRKSPQNFVPKNDLFVLTLGIKNKFTFRVAG